MINLSNPHDGVKIGNDLAMENSYKKNHYMTKY